MSTRAGAPTRFLLFSHDGLGLGHTRRHVAVAAALLEQAPEAAVLLANGADALARIGLPSQVEVLKLPGLRKVSAHGYEARHLPLSSREIHELRSRLMVTAVEAFRPDVMLVDRHPFGIADELVAPLDALRAVGGRAVLGLRDILDSPASLEREWASTGLAERVLDYFDEVLVYGMREIFDPIEACGFPAALLKRTHFCGYIVNRQPSLLRSVPDQGKNGDADGLRPVVLATTGGGEDGSALLEIFLRVAANASWKGVAVAGPMAPETELARLRDLASASAVRLHTGTSDLSGLLARADAIVCMGGYNTLVESLVQGVPAVCVPRIAPREEQALRAATFERLGLLRMLMPERLTCEALADAVSAALQTSRPGLRARIRATLDFDGTRKAAGRLIALAHAVRGARTEAAVAS